MNKHNLHATPAHNSCTQPVPQQYGKEHHSQAPHSWSVSLVHKNSIWLQNTCQNNLPANQLSQQTKHNANKQIIIKSIKSRIKLSNSEPTMSHNLIPIVKNSCNLIVNSVKDSSLNFFLQESPFSIYITIRKSIAKI